MKTASALLRPPQLRRRASVFLISLILVVITGVSVMMWVGYVSDSQRTAARDRARVHATLAAEAGIELVIDWFNNPGSFSHNVNLSVPGNYPGPIPDEYTEDWEVHRVPVPMHLTTELYENYRYNLFEPYALRVLTNGFFEPTPGNNPPRWNESLVLRDGRPVPLDVTWFKNDVSKIPTCELTPPDGRDHWLTFGDETGAVRAKLTRLVLVNPADFEDLGEPENPYPSNRVICKVIAEATAPALEGGEGATIKVECLIRENPLFNLASPGAIVSAASVDLRGQYNVHWGEVWAQETVALPTGFPNSGHLPNPVPRNGSDKKNDQLSIDRWFRLLSAKQVVWSGESITNPTKFASGTPDTGGQNWNGWRSDILPAGEPNHFTVYGTKGPGIPANSWRPYEDYKNILQHQDLLFPHLEYDVVREAIISSNYPYFYTDTDGQLVGYEDGALVKKSYGAWLDRDPQAGDDVYWNMDDITVFIDSVPVRDDGTVARNDEGLPIITADCYPRGPRDPLALIPRISVQGNQGSYSHTRGALFINAHIDFTGAGSAPDHSLITQMDEYGVAQPYVVSPIGNPPPGNNVSISHNGIFYCWGEMSNSANRVIYGCVLTEGGFGAHGGPEVYYNYRLKDGSWLNLNNGMVLRGAWRIRKEEIPTLTVTGG